eukprot:TRINITY_DN3433_c1_g2_i1.p1 TRINITY_DN3433_c1_g2~~TRINITY_DN3433_c1_g2_i1.p1  ORF type:complete len:368 (+),score=100.88 TRINITY_DN3433_c1_g2_i1:30-1106(+)
MAENNQEELLKIINNLKKEVEILKLNLEVSDKQHQKDINEINKKLEVFEEREVQFCKQREAFMELLPLKQNLEFVNLQSQLKFHRKASSSCHVDGKIYVIGGLGNSAHTYLSSIEIYNTQTSTWSLGTPMPFPRNRHCCAAYNGSIYVIGGYTSQGKLCPRVDIYDIKNDTWSEFPQVLPTLRAEVSCAVINDLIYVCGGYDGSHTLSVIEVLDPNKSIWANNSISLRNGRSGHITLVGQNKLFIAGGYRTSFGRLSTVEYYDFSSQSWCDLPSMSTARYFAAGCFINGNLIICGGKHSSHLQTSEILNLAKQQWTFGPDMVSSKYQASFVQVNNKFYLFGGENETGKLNSVECCDLF